MTDEIVIVIPSFEPDEALPALCRSLRETGLNDILVVDDGSGAAYCQIFERIEKDFCIPVIRHAVNLGKGRALKDAFNWLLTNRPGLTGCITADSDGQHTPRDICRCMEQLRISPDSLVLGCRRFDEDNVPRKSRLGNELTRKVCRYLCGINVSDTQTGLRGIPAAFMRRLLSVPGERFEFETRMLIECRDSVPIVEVPIETVYDSKENHRTHFDPVRDSIRIYRIFGRMFLTYLFSSLSSSVLDLLLFMLFVRILRGWNPDWYIAAATVGARVISASYNYMINYRFVFHSRKSRGGSLLRYALLALVQMCTSALLVTAGVRLLSGRFETPVKIAVDSFLFFVSYAMQRKFVF